VPIEFIEILGLMKLTIKHIDLFKEKWGIFNSIDKNIQPYLKDGFKRVPLSQKEEIAKNLGIDIANLDLSFTFDKENNRLKKYTLTYDDRLVIAIWEKIFSDIPVIDI
jgi:hypothetical protein